MLPKNIRTLKRSISEKLLGSSKQPKSQENVTPTPSRAVSTVTPPAAPPQDDPYREILRQYDDNVSHLVLHGSSLRSMTSR